ncbi:hypothetical protein PENSPDRAFT_757913 [Peniophora sp. CONT]|nr:hypothetical protein PENSPDRAFT_757913 [Peniophora sp. CONT]
METASPASPPSWAHGLTMNDRELRIFMDGTSATTKLLIPTIIETCDAIPVALRTMYDNRVPLGPNTDLWNLMNAVDAATSDPAVLMSNLKASTAVISIASQTLFDLLANVVLSGELFKDWPGWIRCVIKLITRFIRIPEGALKTNNPVATQFAEDFLRCNATTSEGMTLSQVLSRLLEQAWEHRHVFSGTNAGTWQSEHLPGAADSIRTALLILLGSAIGLDQLKDICNRDFTQLAFLCWFHEHGEHGDYADQLLFILNRVAVEAHAQGNNDTLETFFTHHVHIYYPPLKVCQRLRETFLRAKVLNEDIGAICVLMTYFIRDHKEKVSYILEASLLQAMCACLKLPLVETKAPPNSSTVHVGYFFALRGCLRGIMGVIIDVLRDFPFSRGAEVLINECDVPLLLSWIFRLAAFYEYTPGPDIETHHYALFTNNTFAELASSPHMRGENNPLRQRFAQALRREWYPVLKLLRRNTTTLVRELYIHKAWENLGKAMGLVENIERKQFDQRAGKMCSLVVCRYYTILPPNTLRACGGCGEVKYHSKPCQTEDWRHGPRGGHKARCKRVN